MNGLSRAVRGIVASFAAISLVLGSLGCWALYFEPSSLRVREYPLAVPGWPVGCDGVRVAVLGDLHVGAPYIGLDKLRVIVEQTNAVQPDLVLLPGDFVITGVLGGQSVPPERFAPLLTGLKAPGGTYAVLGNHDWWYGAQRVRRSLEQAGIPVLENASRPIEVRSCRFWLAGIADYLMHLSAPDIALSQVPAQAAVLAFTHNPDLLPRIPERVSLTVAAHTHGGQVYIPFIGAPIPGSRYGQRYLSGHVIDRGRHMFVHTGIGTSILPVRFLVPPEIAVLKISGVH
jgi:predicted MPP superfamily phosphohydrolase